MALRIFDPVDDLSESERSARINLFANKRSVVLNHYGVRRILFVMCRKGHFPWHYTLRDMGNSWGEEQAIRNVEPSLAYQLELSRLSNYNLSPRFVENKSIHIYHGAARDNQLDNRFFVRALV